MNQSLGRCIRHIKDYGAIALLDPRYQRPDAAAQLSKWTRTALQQHDLADLLVPLRLFFQRAEVEFPCTEQPTYPTASAGVEACCNSASTFSLSAGSQKRESKKRQRQGQGQGGGTNGGSDKGKGPKYFSIFRKK